MFVVEQMGFSWQGLWHVCLRILGDIQACYSIRAEPWRPCLGVLVLGITLPLIRGTPGVVFVFLYDPRDALVRESMTNSGDDAENWYLLCSYLASSNYNIHKGLAHGTLILNIHTWRRRTVFVTPSGVIIQSLSSLLSWLGVRSNILEK